MEQAQELILILEGIDIEKDDDQTVTESFAKVLEKKGYKPADNTVTLRNEKLSSIRAIEINSGEEVEMYAFSKKMNNRTVVSIKII
ncbi:hypothetical protein [Persephonella sp.]